MSLQPDRFVAHSNRHTLPLILTPRSRRFAKALGEAGDRQLTFHADENVRRYTPCLGACGTLNDAVERRQLTKTLYEIPVPQSRTSASTNLLRQPEMTLSAIGAPDDFYARPVSWSKSNVLAVATRYSVNYRHMGTSAIGNIANFLPLEFPTCIEWNPDSATSKQLLAVGFQGGDVRVVDIAAERRPQTWVAQYLAPSCHGEYVGGISWRDENVLTVGYESGGMRTFDLRDNRNNVRTSTAHKSRVCGISWSPDQRFLATGGGNGVVACWDSRALSNPLLTFDHRESLENLSHHPSSSNSSTLSGSSRSGVSRRWRGKKHISTVKALAWCPWTPNVLATGGGTKDGTIRFWCATTGATQVQTSVIRTNAQVSSLHFAPTCREIVATLGYAFAPVVPEAGGELQIRPAPRRHSILVHHYPNGEVTGRIFDVGHGRISDGCLNPEGTHLVTCGADETIRIFKIFGKQSKVEIPRDSVQTLNLIR